MGTVSIEDYAEAFSSRCGRAERAGQALVEVPGARGLIATQRGGRIRLMVSDDRALDLVDQQVSMSPTGTIIALGAASDCRALVLGQTGWNESIEGRLTLMGASDLEGLPDGRLPRGLAWCKVRRTAADPSNGVSLTAAVDLMVRATGRAPRSVGRFVEGLRSLPAEVQVFAGVDEAGVVRATSGNAVHRCQADVLFVNTDPDWRGCGVGAAMTAAALGDARRRGASFALLDATEAGRRIYRRLGFVDLAQATRFEREDPVPSGPPVPHPTSR